MNNLRSDLGFLGLTLREDEGIRIGDDIYIKCRKAPGFMGGKKLRIVISAPKDVLILRDTLADIQSPIESKAESKRRKYKAGQGNEA